VQKRRPFGAWAKEIAVTVLQALAAFTLAAGLLTILPGLDTAMVLRTAAAEGPRRGALAALGIGAGCLVWGLAIALGLGALLAASQGAYTVLKWAGAAYLLWMGLGLLLKPRSRFDLDAAPVKSAGDGGWFVRGLATNLLNPKIGVFYVSFLPQFTPAHVPAGPFIMVLAVIHVVLGLIWSAGLILATRPLKAWLANSTVIRRLDRVTGGVFILFAGRLILEPR
jgi:threonine/homoserine/homoserine lactone efflux protein